MEIRRKPLALRIRGGAIEPPTCKGLKRWCCTDDALFVGFKARRLAKFKLFLQARSRL